MFLACSTKHRILLARSTITGILLARSTITMPVGIEIIHIASWILLYMYNYHHHGV